MFKVLDLFSGIGGFSLGLERAGMETVAFCEIDEQCRKVLNKHWPDVYIHNDIKSLRKVELPVNDIENAINDLLENHIDVICGGFPCQDVSIAGHHTGLKGIKSGLWGEYARLISEIRPKYAIVENVTGLLSGENGEWFGEVLGDLAKIGYDAIWNCIPASAIGAPHQRDRVWIIAYPNGEFLWKSEKSRRKRSIQAVVKRNSKKFANTKCQGLQRYLKKRLSLRKFKRKTFTKFGDRNIYIGDEFKKLSEYIRMGDGVSRQSHRLKQLGNSVVPQIPEIIGKMIINFESVQNNNPENV